MCGGGFFRNAVCFASAVRRSRSNLFLPDKMSMPQGYAWHVGFELYSIVPKIKAKHCISSMCSRTVAKKDLNYTPTWRKGTPLVLRTMLVMDEQPREQPSLVRLQASLQTQLRSVICAAVCFANDGARGAKSRLRRHKKTEAYRKGMLLFLANSHNYDTK